MAQNKLQCESIELCQLGPARYNKERWAGTGCPGIGYSVNT